MQTLTEKKYKNRNVCTLLYWNEWKAHNYSASLYNFNQLFRFLVKL